MVKIIKSSKRGITLYGLVREYKADKVKIALFDTKDFICPFTKELYYGHYLKDDWFELDEVMFL